MKATHFKKRKRLLIASGRILDYEVSYATAHILMKAKYNNILAPATTSDTQQLKTRVHQYT
jgi:hypothetical protein